MRDSAGPFSASISNIIVIVLANPIARLVYASQSWVGISR